MSTFCTKITNLQTGSFVKKHLEDLKLSYADTQTLLNEPNAPNAVLSIGNNVFLAHLSQYQDMSEVQPVMLAHMYLKRAKITTESGQGVNFFEIVQLEPLPENYKEASSIYFKGFLATKKGSLKVNNKAAGLTLDFSVVVKDIEGATHLTYCRAFNDTARQIDSIFLDKEKNKDSVYIYLQGTFTRNANTQIIFTTKSASLDRPD